MTATATEPEWASQFSDDQLALYDTALDLVDTYERRAEPVWAAGEASAAAKELFQEFLSSWQVYWLQLKDFDKQHITIAHRPKVLSSEPTRITESDKSVVVVMVQCIDARDVDARQGDKPLKLGFDSPQVRDAWVERIDGRWFITKLETSSKDRPCAG